MSRFAPAPFRPRLIDALRGYSARTFQGDLGAGLTVAIVALPLAMAFAIASGLKPEAGLWTAILGGLLVAEWPSDSLWAVGTLFGISLFFSAFRLLTTPAEA